MEISADNFYKLGYNISSINSKIADRLLQESRSLPYLRESGEYGTGNLTHIFPEFDKTPEITTQTTPFIEDFWSDFQARLKFVTNHMGSFSHRKIMTHRYSKAEGMNWHHDLFDGTVALNILYLTKDRFEPQQEDGGELVVGHGDVDNMGRPCWLEYGPDAISLVGRCDEVAPQHGVIVTINNMNPTIFHKVHRLNCFKERITMSCQFGYIEHIRRREGMSHV